MDAETPESWFSEEVATFGDRLTAAREAAGMTQKLLATRLGVRLTTVQSWENDLAEPRSNRLQMLAGMLSVSLMWLLTGEGDGVNGPRAGAAPQPTTDASILQGVHEIGQSVAELAARLARLEAKLAQPEEDGDDRSA